MKEKYTENMDMSVFKSIPEVSFYNHQYLIGIDGNLLFCESNDVSGESEWSIVTKYGHKLLGYTDMDNLLHLTDNYHN